MSRSVVGHRWEWSHNTSSSLPQHDASSSRLSTAQPSALTTTGKGRKSSGSKSSLVTGNPPKATRTASQLPIAAVNNDDDSKTPAIREGVKHNPKQPRASDFEETVKAVILRACFEYESMISTINPFPETADRIKLAAKCWRHACADIGEKYTLTSAIQILVSLSCIQSGVALRHAFFPQIGERATRIRSHALTKIRQRVEFIFGFDHRKDRRTIAKNKKLCEKLRTDSAFRYKARLFLMFPHDHADT